jgi:hypothetical protein
MLYSVSFAHWLYIFGYVYVATALVLGIVKFRKIIFISSKFLVISAIVIIIVLSVTFTILGFFSLSNNFVEGVWRSSVYALDVLIISLFFPIVLLFIKTREGIFAKTWILLAVTAFFLSLGDLSIREFSGLIYSLGAITCLSAFAYNAVSFSKLRLKIKRGEKISQLYIDLTWNVFQKAIADYLKFYNKIMGEATLAVVRLALKESERLYNIKVEINKEGYVSGKLSDTDWKIFLGVLKNKFEYITGPVVMKPTKQIVEKYGKDVEFLLAKTSKSHIIPIFSFPVIESKEAGKSP